jgi:hypothetical protein
VVPLGSSFLTVLFIVLSLAGLTALILATLLSCVCEIIVLFRSIALVRLFLKNFVLEL